MSHDTVFKMANNKKPQAKKYEKESSKKSLPPPTNISSFIVILILTLCKKVLLIDTAVKIGTYLLIVLIGSVIADFSVLPKFYLAEKHNILNRFFVRMGWGWTFILLSMFIFMTSYVYTLGNLKNVLKHLCRLAVATFWWYFITSAFRRVEEIVGVCSEPTKGSKMSCIKSGKLWLGFDISGHTFLLIHCLLTISEEVRCFKDWKKLGQILTEDNIVDKRNLKKSDVENSLEAYNLLSPYVKAIFTSLAICTVIFEFMLLITTVYRFHTLSQKVTAAFIAVGCWFISYRILVPSSFDVIKKSGDSVLKFTKLV
ncbi:acyl-coenzyme A diphosphatase FITM2-like [Mytilus trossulus]|uniref:acyl-coenzyme A diphosphatase FITM2-like n=1 Tax=Mytilus trossulus TaxID=6551 RepID=UPI00300527AF